MGAPRAWGGRDRHSRGGQRRHHVGPRTGHVPRISKVGRPVPSEPHSPARPWTRFIANVKATPGPGLGLSVTRVRAQHVTGVRAQYDWGQGSACDVVCAVFRRPWSGSIWVDAGRTAAHPVKLSSRPQSRPLGGAPPPPPREGQLRPSTPRPSWGEGTCDEGSRWLSVRGGKRKACDSTSQRCPHPGVSGGRSSALRRAASLQGTGWRARLQGAGCSWLSHRP